MKKLTILALTLALFVPVVASAQYDDPSNDVPLNPNYEDPGGGGTGGTYRCYRTEYSGNSCYCHAEWHTNSINTNIGYLSCTAHNVAPGAYGPGFCEVSGSCEYYPQPGSTIPSEASDAIAAERGSIQILYAMVELKLMTREEAGDFMIRVDEQVGTGMGAKTVRQRSTMYRDEFAALTGVALRPGAAPALPSDSNPPRNSPPPNATLD